MAGACVKRLVELPQTVVSIFMPELAAWDYEYGTRQEVFSTLTSTSSASNVHLGRKYD
jgi:hypothetical protein